MPGLGNALKKIGANRKAARKARKRKDALMRPGKSATPDNPIEVKKHEISNEPRYGVNGVPYIEKEYSVWRGSQRVQAAKQLGYTHIEAVVINE